MISFKKIWSGSIAVQLMLGIAFVHAVLMTIFVVDLVNRERSFLIELSQKQAIGLAETLAANGTSWLLAHDIIGMEEIIRSQSGFPGLKYAMFLDTKGKVLAYTDTQQVGKYVDDAISKTILAATPETYTLIDHVGFIDVATPIFANNQQIGWARVGISREGITNNIRHVTQNGLIYTLVAIAVGTIFAWCMGRGLTRGLRSLSQATHQVAQGDREVQCDLRRHDELGRLSRDFTKMLTIITDKEDELTQNIALLDALLDSVPDLVSYKDLQGRYLGCNRSFEGLVHCPKGDIVGKTDSELFTGELEDFLGEKDQEVLESAETQQIENWVDYPDGRHILLNTLKVPFFTGDGERIGLISIARDITRLRGQEEQLRRSRKMDALGKLTGGIAHDYNNLLAIILGFAELLEDKLSNDLSLKRYASQILGAGRRGASLTQKLLTFSRNSPAKIEKIDINQAIENAYEMIEKSLTVSIKVELSLDEDIWSTVLDGADFDNALINLCINAMHAMGGTGRLFISTANVHHGAVQGARLGLDPGEYVSLAIADTGVGMDEETISKIFDPFFSTKGKLGTGLGLSQVYGFVTRSKGAVAVDSQLNGGSTFTLYFPRNVDMEEEQQHGESVAPRQEGDQQRILVVDDEEALCELTFEILSRGGYTPFTARGGAEALEILAREDIDLLMTDIVMPGMNGRELADQARGIQPTLRVLFISGYNDQEAESGQEEGHIQKPIRAADLLARVANILLN